MGKQCSKGYVSDGGVALTLRSLAAKKVIQRCEHISRLSEHCARHHITSDFCICYHQKTI